MYICTESRVTFSWTALEVLLPIPKSSMLFPPFSTLSEHLRSELCVSLNHKSSGRLGSILSRTDRKKFMSIILHFNRILEKGYWVFTTFFNLSSCLWRTPGVPSSLMNSTSYIRSARRRRKEIRISWKTIEGNLGLNDHQHLQRIWQPCQLQRVYHRCESSLLFQLKRREEGRESKVEISWMSENDFERSIKWKCQDISIITV